MGQSVRRAKLDEATRTMLLTALDEAIELAIEGWAYASDYFREKWEYEPRIDGLRKVLETYDDR